MTLLLSENLAVIRADETSGGDVQAIRNHLSQVFNIREHSVRDRADAERFIRERFFAAHGARIAHFMPRLFSLLSRRGDLIAAFGLRPAAAAPLFLEAYLDQPVEAVLQKRLGVPVRREEVIEVGNLSALYPGAARWLIVAVTALLYEEGYRWVTFTGTPMLRNGFHRLGLRPVELGAATIDRLPLEQRSDWGSYYEQAPTVMAGDIGHGFRSLLMQRDLAALLRTGMDSVEKGERL